MDCKSKLVVLEGLDGSGKSTQFERLGEYLASKGVKLKAISFPDYDQPSSALVKMYLNGEFSESAGEVMHMLPSFMLWTDMRAIKNSGKRIMLRGVLFLPQDMLLPTVFIRW